jgi:hypothetical protein
MVELVSRARAGLCWIVSITTIIRSISLRAGRQPWLGEFDKLRSCWYTLVIAA